MTANRLRKLAGDSPGGLRRRFAGRTCQPKLVRLFLERRDYERDVFAEIDAEELRAQLDFFAVDAGGEFLVLELLEHARRFKHGDTIGPQPGTGDDEAGQFIAGQERLVE